MLTSTNMATVRNFQFYIWEIWCCRNLYKWV